MKRQTLVTGVLALGMLLGSGSCILACGCGRPPASVVHGTVRAQDGRGVANAGVEIRGAGGTGGSAWRQTVTSAADGAYRFPEVQGQRDYTLMLMPPPGYRLADTQPVLTPIRVGPEDTVRVDFALHAY